MLKLASDYINDNYGSRRGLLNASRERLHMWLGGYRAFRAVEWERVERLIFICHGNICRSPLAEVYARSLGVPVESYGLKCRNDAEADPRAVRYASGIELDLSGHRTRNISLFGPRATDLLVVMEPVHLAGVAHIARDAQVTLAGLWLSSPSPYIHDPFSSNEIFFARCEDMVVSSARVLADHLRRRKS